MRAGAPVRATSSCIHGAHLSHIRVVRLFGETAYGGTPVSFCAPHFRVAYDKGDSKSYRGNDIAKSLVHGAKDLGAGLLIRPEIGPNCPFCLLSYLVYFPWRPRLFSFGGQFTSPLFRSFLNFAPSS